MLRIELPRRWLTALIVVGTSFGSTAVTNFAMAQATSRVTVTDLRTEYRKDPEGIDARKPRLSWIMVANERGQMQSAYQVLVASSAAKLARDEGDRWDSGRVESDRSIQVRYAGQPLESFAECFWKVRVWDKDGRPSPWSRPARWSMGVLESSGWGGAQWIGLEEDDTTEYLTDTNWIWYPEGNPAEVAPPEPRYLRRVFEIPHDRRIVNATFRIAADNHCQIYLNGRDVGGRRGYRSTKEMDLTHRLMPGKNSIALVARSEGSAPKPAAVTVWLRVEFDRGEPLLIRTDEAWRASADEAAGWTDRDFDDSHWVPALNIGPVGMSPWGEVRCAEDRRLAARWLRKEFSLDSDVRRATVTMCGQGLSELYINGERIGDHVLSPAMTEYPKRVLYVTHDVTQNLRDGENALGVVLGNGRFWAPRSRIHHGMPSFGYPKLLLLLRIEHTDSTVSDVVSDQSWRLTDDGPIVANNEYDGEEYDARRELTGWSSPGYHDSAWRAVDLASEPTSTVAAQMMEPIRVTQTLRPIAVTEPQPGVFIFDMGQNMVGWCRLTVSGPAGAEVRLRHAEVLEDDGTLYLANIRGAKVTDVYTLSGEGTEVWEPRFAYHGFRYVEVTGYPGRPTLESLEGRVVHDDLRRTGTFECSNPLLNQIVANIIWGLRGNYRSVPTDCPQRDERQGWLGDRTETARGETYLFDVAAFHSKWLQDMEDSQKESGSIADVAPAHWPFYNDSVTWPSASVVIPSTLYRQYADEAIIARHYDSAKRWIDYMLGFVEEDGTIAKDSYGDWCMPPEDPTLIHSKDPSRITNKALLATSYFYYDLRLMERYANMLGKQDDAARFGELAEKFAMAFNDRFLDRDEGQYDNGTQTSAVLPLAFGLVPEDQQDRVFANLVRNIHEVTNGHIGTGLIGAQFLNRVLSDRGQADLAYTIATQEAYPSFGYMISEGATTIWELWNGNTADPAMNSHNHVMLVGDLVIWLFEYVAGIRPDEADPGFKHIIMRPHPVGDLTFVNASFRSPHGLVESRWRKDGERFDWRITVPANATATVHIPAAEVASVAEGSGPAEEADGVEFLRMDDDHAVFRVGSGDYHFVSE